MREELRRLLIDPRDGGALELTVADGTVGEVVTGRLRAADGHEYPVRAGIPRFFETAPTLQGQTSGSFGYKWTRTDTYLSPAMRDRKSTRLNSSHVALSRMPSSA